MATLQADEAEPVILTEAQRTDWRKLALNKGAARYLECVPLDIE